MCTRERNEVQCRIEQVMIESESGRFVEGTRATCLACDHSAESFGRTDRSVRRCLAMLHEECPLGENNFYVPEVEKPKWWSTELVRGREVGPAPVLFHRPLKPPTP